MKIPSAIAATRLIRSHLWILAIWVCGLLLTAVLTTWVRGLQQERLKNRFDTELERVSDDLRRRFEMPIYGLKGARGAYATAGQLTRKSFRRYVDSRDLASEFPGVRGIGFIEPVKRVDLDAFVIRERLDEAPEFSVRSMGEDRADLYVVKYIEPLMNNRAAVGLDLASEAVRREGVERAATSGKPALSGTLRLVQDSKARPGFAMFVPVYRPGLPLETHEQRAFALYGLMYSPIVLEELLMPSLELLRSSGLHIQISDKAMSEGGQTLYQTDIPSKNPLLSVEIPLSGEGFTLFLRAQSTPAMEENANHFLVFAMGLAGLMLSTLLCWVLWLESTARAKAEARSRNLALEVNKLALVAERTTNAVLMTDANSRITWVNEGFTRVSGYTAAEAQGKFPGELLGSGLADPVTLEKLKNSADQGTACRVEILNRAKDGRLYWIDLELQPIHNDEGELIGLIEIGLDVTEKKRQAEALTAAKDQAEKANKAKSQFLATMSHELRTPLNAVLGFSQVLEDSLVEPVAKRQARYIRETGETLNTILNDILDVSKIEAGKFYLDPRPFEMAQVFESCGSIFRVVAANQGIDFTLSLPPDLPPLLGDPIRLRQILQNLLSNAFKFTSKGHVRATLEVLQDRRGGDGAGSIQFKLQVSDSGIGMKAEQMERLFQRFEQADRTTGTRFGGTGLGLAIVKALTEMMGGEVAVESRFGEGTTFHLTLPFEVALTAVATHSAVDLSPEDAPLKVLVVDDFPVNRMVLRALLERRGHTVSEAEDGVQAIDRVTAESPDLILMDLDMPHLDGYAAAQRIRAMTNTVLNRVPIYALSGKTFAEDISKATQVGMDGHLSKPVQLPELVRVLKTVGRATQRS